VALSRRRSVLLRPRALVWGALLVALQSLAGCGGEDAAPAGEVRRVVERDALFWDGDRVPADVVAFLTGTRVLVVGEVHQSRDHYALWAGLVPALHQAGVRQLLLEWPQAGDWRLNAFARGDAGLNWQPSDILGGQWIRAIRTLNQSLPETERIAVRAIDVNHPGYGGARTFSENVVAFADSLGDAADLTTWASAYPGDAAGQRQALASFRGRLTSERDTFVSRWGQSHYDTVLEMVDIETDSVGVRESWDRDYDGAFRRREDVMKRLAEARLAETRGRTIVNVGGSHAQKERHRGTQQEWLGEYLVRRSPAASGQTLTLWVTGSRGEYRFNDTPTSFDLRTQSPENEVLRITSELAGSRTALLPLSDPIFLDRQVAVNYLEGVFICSPKRQYDAFIVMPEMRLVGR
jgi:hypothetical protein